MRNKERAEVLTSFCQLVIEVTIISIMVCNRIPPAIPDQIPCNTKIKISICIQISQKRHKQMLVAEDNQEVERR